MLNHLRLKKGEDRRIRKGHPWIFSNEINTTATPLKSFEPGEEVIVESADHKFIGIAYVNPYSLIAARLFSRHPEDRLDQAFFIKQFKIALALREQLFAKPFYRLIYAEADHLPGLIIDRFGDDFVLQINTAGMEKKREVIVAALCTLFTVRSILYRNDSSIRVQENLPQYVSAAFGQPPNEIALEENAVQFIAPLSGQKTGWFYDHRLNRQKLKAYVKNKSVLDVFSYVGGFGIQAATFGATAVTCIETSELACSFIEKNAKLNHVEQKVKIICDEALKALKHLLTEGKRFDVIILDPPAFVKKRKDKHEGLMAYQRLNELAIKLLKEHGVLVSCSCSMHISMEDLTNVINNAALRARCQLQILERGHQGPDHPLHLSVPELDYLKALWIRKTEG